MMENYGNVLVSISDAPLTEEDNARLSALGASWVFVNNREGRVFVDLIAPLKQLQAIEDELAAMGRDPKPIGRFDHEGTSKTELKEKTEGEVREEPVLEEGGKAPADPLVSEVEWKKVAQDIVTYDTQGQELTRTRPTEFVQTHKWAGWGDKVVP